MAQSGYTPILIYASGTAAALPSAANLTSSANGAELALNYADGKLYYKNSSGVVTLLANAATAAGSPPGGSNTQVQYNNSGAFAGSANFVWDNSNVRLGIGTSSPQTLLQISSVTPIFSLYESDGAVDEKVFDLRVNSKEFSIRSVNDAYTAANNVIAATRSTGIDIDNVRFFTGAGSERMRILSGGKVLINATTDRDKWDNSTIGSNLLQVERSASGGNSSISVTNNPGTFADAFSLLYLGRSRGTANNDYTAVASGDGLGVVSFQGADGTEFVEAASIRGYVDGTPGANDMPGRLMFFTTPDGSATPAERMRITSSGNVGIADSSPGYKLTVASNALIYTDSVSSNNYSLTNGGTNYGGGIAPYLTVAGAGGSYGYLLIKGGSGGTSNTANIGLANRNSAGNYILGALLGCDVTTATAGSEVQFFKIALNSGGSVIERMRIDSSGNVGIGVTPPTVSQGRLLSLAYSGSGISVTSGTSLDLTNNAYYNSGWKYGQSGKTARIQLSDDQIYFGNATTGTAGNAITFTQTLAIQQGKTLALEGASLQTGTGITFPATQSASSDANTLDDYEEGTWTPTLTSAGGAFSGLGYTGQVGKYTKVGNLVWVYGVLATTSSFTGGSGLVSFAGLPFTVGTSGIGVVYVLDNAGVYVQPSALPTRVVGSGTTVGIYKDGSTANPSFTTTNLVNQNSNGNYFQFSLSYTV